MDQDQPADKHMQEREAEKTADLESLADALATFRQLHRDLDQWERVHLALGLAAVVSGCYGIGELEAALALTPEIERSPSAKLPSGSSLRAIRSGAVRTGPERSLGGTGAALSAFRPHRTPMTVPGLRSWENRPVRPDPSALFFLVVADHDRGFFCIEGPMTDDQPWQDAALHARNQCSGESCAGRPALIVTRSPPTIVLPKNKPVFRREAS